MKQNHPAGLEHQMTHLLETLSQSQQISEQTVAKTETVSRRLKQLHRRIQKHQQGLHALQERLERCAGWLRDFSDV